MTAPKSTTETIKRSMDFRTTFVRNTMHLPLSLTNLDGFYVIQPVLRWEDRGSREVIKRAARIGIDARKAQELLSSYVYASGRTGRTFATHEAGALLRVILWILNDDDDDVFAATEALASAIEDGMISNV